MSNKLYSDRDGRLRDFGIARSKPISFYAINRSILLSRILKWFSKTRKSVSGQHSRRASRELFLNLPLHYLKDIGLTRHDVDALFLGKACTRANDNSSKPKALRKTEQAKKIA